MNSLKKQNEILARKKIVWSNRNRHVQVVKKVKRRYIIKKQKKKKTTLGLIRLVWFYGISTIVGYLMSYPFFLQID